MICCNCGHKNHITKDCKWLGQPKCDKCGWFGHIGSDCCCQHKRKHDDDDRGKEKKAKTEHANHAESDDDEDNKIVFTANTMNNPCNLNHPSNMGGNEDAMLLYD